MVIYIDVIGKIARLKNDGVFAVCGNSDYIIHFDFDDPEWNSYTVKTARFKFDGQFYEVLFWGNEVEMPTIENSYSVEIGVYAGDLRTTTPAYLPLKKSILSGDGEHIEPPEDIYNQIMSALNSKADFNQGAENSGKVWKVGPDGDLVLSEGGGGGDAFVYMRVSGGYIQYSNDQITWHNVISVSELVGPQGSQGPQGETGPQGPKGDKGDKGDAGETGAQGPQGPKGDTGDQGPAGPTGPQGETGPQGTSGQNGADGYTPIKGIDYWTADDKEDIVKDVLDALPVWEGGSY